MTSARHGLRCVILLGLCLVAHAEGQDAIEQWAQGATSVSSSPSRHEASLFQLGGEADASCDPLEAFDFGANAFYLTALKHGSFTWVAAISSLYPVSTVLLARVVLHERLARLQIVGLVMAGIALTLVAVGANL